MGRKSALSPEQWGIVEHRHLVDGVSLNALAKEYGVNESTLRRKIGNRSVEAGIAPNLREMAMRKSKAELAVAQVTKEIDALPVAKQMIVSDLARKLSAISTHVASSAEYMAATSHRLAAISNALMDKVDDADPIASTAILTQAAGLIRLSNDAAHIPLNLLKANQQTIDNMNRVESEEVPAGLGHFYGE